MSVEKWWNEICGRGKREKTREKPTQTSFSPPRNPHGGTETRTRVPSGGRRAANRLRHEAAIYWEMFVNLRAPTGEIQGNSPKTAVLLLVMQSGQRKRGPVLLTTYRTFIRS